MSNTSFTDTKGNTWNINITVGTIKEVRRFCNIDLSNAIDLDEKGRPKADVLMQLASDSVLLVDTLYVICKSQAEHFKISDVDFAGLFAGDVIVKATDALMQGILEFLPPAKRLVMEKIRDTANRNTARIMDQAQAIFNNPEFDKELDRVWQEQFANTPESSE